MSQDLPEGWARARLDDVFTPRSERVSPSDFPDWPYVGMEHIEAHTNRLLCTVPANTMSSSAARFYSGDVLYGRMRPYLNKVALTSFEGLASAEFIVFPAIADMSNSFLLWRLSSSDFVEFACSQYEGDRPRVKFEQLGKFELLVPPAAEQDRIVEKLEELLSDLDASVAELKAAQRKLAQYRQSLLKAAVEGALTADWRAARARSGEPQETGADLLQRILTERRYRWEQKQLERFADQGKAPPKDWRVKYPEPVAPEAADLPVLPEGWVWVSLDTLLGEIEAGKSFKCEERPPSQDEVGVVKVSAVTWGEYDEEESKTCQDDGFINPDLFVNEGDFLFSRANTIDLVGACVIAKHVTKRIMLSDKILRLTLIEPTLACWLLSVLRSPHGRKQIESLSSGNQESMRNIGQERLKKIAVPLPPTTEAAMASDLLGGALESSQDIRTAIERSLTQTVAQRKNLLRAAFTGQLVPQNPHDEPASALLERIRAERATRDGAAKPRGRKPRTTA